MKSHDDAIFYETAASEISSGNPNRGLLAKAYSNALGDSEKTKAFYIQYRVEQLKHDFLVREEAMRRNAEEENRRQFEAMQLESLGRERYLSALKAEFAFLRRRHIPDSEVPSSNYTGCRESLPYPRKLSDVSEALNLLDFELIDAVKAGLILGVREKNDDWWISRLPS